MSKYLVIVLGQQFVKPMVVRGEISINLLVDESKNNTLLYLVYTYNDKYDIYVPFYSIYLGNREELSNCYVYNVRIR